MNSAVDDPNTLGAANGVATAICALGRACGPFFVNWAYGLSVQNQTPIAVWLVMIGVTAVSAIQTRFVRFKSE